MSNTNDVVDHFPCLLSPFSAFTLFATAILDLENSAVHTYVMSVSVCVITVCLIFLMILDGIYGYGCSRPKT